MKKLWLVLHKNTSGDSFVFLQQALTILTAFLEYETGFKLWTRRRNSDHAGWRCVNWFRDSYFWVTELPFFWDETGSMSEPTGFQTQRAPGRTERTTTSCLFLSGTLVMGWLCRPSFCLHVPRFVFRSGGERNSLRLRSDLQNTC